MTKMIMGGKILMGLESYWRKNGHIIKLEIILLIPIIITGLLTFLLKDTGLKYLFYIYIIFFFFASWFFTIIFTELIIEYLKNEGRIKKLKHKFPKKPRIFEYLFFLGLFWATALITVAYSYEINTGLDLFQFINTFGASIFVYGFSSACGWYHYIERIDEDW